MAEYRLNSAMRLHGSKGTADASTPGSVAEASNQQQPFSFDYCLPLDDDTALDVESNAITTTSTTNQLTSATDVSEKKAHKHVPPRIDQDLYQAEIDDFIGGDHTHTGNAVDFQRRGNLLFITIKANKILSICKI